MNSSRLKQLLEFHKNDPNDPFTLYAIATEYRDDNPEKALYYYEELLKKHADYLATYYHVAQLYLELGQEDKAESAFINGIKLATEQSNALALRELQNAYNEWLFDE